MELLAIVLLGALLASFGFISPRGRLRIPRRKKKHRRRHFKTRAVPFDEKSTKSIQEGTVISGRAFVIDGDSIVVKKTQIRLFGIDAPELNHPFGQKAKWALVSLCKGQTIHAKILAEDDHGRTVAQCFLPDGRDLSGEMVQLGLAIDWPKFSGGLYRHLEVNEVRRKLWLTDARQKGRMHVWEQYEARRNSG